ncbi:MAG: ABC transporter substrate-binding protein [Desulfitobacteriaceae bacterium]
MHNKGLRFIGFVLIVVILLLDSGATSATMNQSNAEKVLIYALESDPLSFDPSEIEDQESAQVVINIFDTLVQYQAGSTEVETALATTWTTSFDGLEWTFKLRQGVKFHDGTLFNAQAVKSSFERQFKDLEKSGALPYADFTLGMVQNIKIIDNYTVTFKLKYPYAPFLRNLAMPYSAPIISAEAVKKYGKNFATHPVGTGPFIFESWEPGRRIVLKANPDYWDGKPKLDKVIFQIVKGENVRLNKLAQGTVDIVNGIAPGSSVDGLLKDEHKFRVWLSTGLNINYLGFRVDKKPFNDLKIREAVTRAIDREKLVKRLYKGQAIVAQGPLPSIVLGYKEDLKAYSYDPERAKQLLREAGYVDNLSFELLSYSEQRPYNEVGGDCLAEAIKDYLSKVGIKVKITSETWQEHKENLRLRKGDAFLYGWLGDNGDPDNFLYPLLHGSQISVSSLNYSNYNNPTYNALIVKAQAATESSERIRKYALAQKILVADAPWIFISHALNVVVTHQNVEGLCVSPTGLVNLAKAEKVEARGTRREAAYTMHNGK